ncbi:MAG TPA: GntR family transcriptional regulator [Caldilineaceae bacterium]|nr:GntR family transcriptional regulator [Caldilineaceae bacterium]
MLSEKADQANGQSSLNRHVLRDEIKEHLIDGILHGKFQPGERLTELTLARQLGVSQAPIREALGHLELMGFVQSIPYKGTYVRQHSPEQLCDIYTVRAWLEALAGHLAAPRFTDQDLQELAGLVEQMMEHARQGNAHDFYKADYAFHQVIIRVANNSMLNQLFDMLQYAYWTFVSTILLNPDLVYLAQRHYAVLDSLRTRDAELAAQVLRTHIEELIAPLSTKSLSENFCVQLNLQENVSGPTTNFRMSSKSASQAAGQANKGTNLHGSTNHRP